MTASVLQPKYKQPLAQAGVKSIFVDSIFDSH